MQFFASLLTALQNHQHKSLSDSSTRRRASVAILFRINPSLQITPPTTIENLKKFVTSYSSKSHTFEILFIKRALRKSDRWSGHVR